jgi:hypothetical protein
MDKFFQNIIPRLKNYSQDLNRKEVFVDKPWLFTDDNNNNHEYLFLRDNRLIMSLNGKAITGSWELLPNGKLLINRIEDQIMLENMFIDEAIMVLKRSRSNEMAFVLVNPTIIPDLDAQRYLNEISQEKSNLEEDKLLGTNEVRLTEFGVVVGSIFYAGISN